MNIRKYTKPALTTNDQIDLLKNRGLVLIGDEDQLLSTVSLHRISTYFHPFKTPTNDQFLPNTSLDKIWDLYTFDGQLRLLILDAIERIEIALRTALSNTLSCQYSPWWYLEDKAFKTNWSSCTPFRQSPKESLISEIKQICKNKKHNEEIGQYYDKYDDPPYPPSWIIIEFLSFGQCTSLFRYLRSPQDKAAVCAVFHFHHKIVESMLEPLRYTRNLCAHHSRLWDRWFVYKPRAINELHLANCKPGTIKEQLALLYLLNERISPKSSWIKRLYNLFDSQSQPSISMEKMGFQQDWQNDPFWEL